MNELQAFNADKGMDNVGSMARCAAMTAVRLALERNLTRICPANVFVSGELPGNEKAE